ncbi:MAG TPA: hypothetical protein VF635_17715 [Propionibacteriaceae bacterium]
MTERTGETGSEQSAEQTEPEQVLDAAAVDVEEAPTKRATPKRRAPAIERPYPRKTLEDALKVPVAIKTGNNGNPWPPDQVAKALGMGTGSSFFYLTQAARDYGLTEGTRDAANISLTPLGRKAVFPSTPQDAEDAKLEAFTSVEKFGDVAKHYGGSNLPADEFVRNTLQTQFGLDPRVHEEFLDFFKKNARFVGIGADWDGGARAVGAGAATTSPVNGRTPVTGETQPPVAPRAEGGRLVCFVAMPFSEKTDEYATGFFTEVFASLFKPAIEAAGFVATTAKRQGSDVIQATIVNDLLDADLVLCDLTEHNPNVLFELGLRIAEKRPTVLVKAAGTNPIFDVDHLLRVESYNPNMWPSTVKVDVPRLTAHIEGAWAARDSGGTYMDILRQQAVPVA